jgi:hypothetical protein
MFNLNTFHGYIINHQITVMSAADRSHLVASWGVSATWMPTCCSVREYSYCVTMPQHGELNEGLWRGGGHSKNSKYSLIPRASRLGLDYDAITTYFLFHIFEQKHLSELALTFRRVSFYTRLNVKIFFFKRYFIFKKYMHLIFQKVPPKIAIEWWTHWFCI